MTICFACRECGAKDNEAEVVIDAGPEAAHYGIPEMSSPGCGAEWHAEADVACYECGAVHDQDWMDANLNDEVQERASEPPDDGPEWDDTYDSEEP